MKRRKTLLFLILSLCLIAILTLSATASLLGNDALNIILSEQPSDHIEQMGGSFFGLLVMIFIIYIINKIVKHEDKKYKESDYYKQTGIPYKVVKNDTGLYGEYLIRLDLDRINGYKRLLSNCYITKSNGETTEVDLIMIHETGIYVFESKNYGGWIFGEEDSEQWMQTFKSGEKNNFFNPIMQNKGHIYAIKKALSMYDDSTFKSIVVFGNGCTFKKMRVRTPVIHRKDVVRVVQKLIKKRPPIFTEEQVDELYEKLFPYTQVSQDVKEKHIQEIKSKYR